MLVINGIEIAYGVLAVIGVLVSWFAVLDAIRVRRYHRQHPETVPPGEIALQLRYGAERIREEVFSAVIEVAMGLAAASALVQNAEPGPQPRWASTLVLALCVAQVLFVTKIIMRRIARRRMLRALAQAEEQRTGGGGR